MLLCFLYIEGVALYMPYWGIKGVATSAASSIGLSQKKARSGRFLATCMASIMPVTIYDDWIYLVKLAGAYMIV